MAWLAFKSTTRIPSTPLRLTAKVLSLFLALASTLLLLLSWPTGSIDISDLWLFLGFSLIPFLPALGWRLFGYVKSRWVRVAGKVTMSVLLLPAGLIFLLLCLAESGCTERVPPIYSPDGKHLALLQFALAEPLLSDYGNVYVRRSWWPFAHHIYHGPGPWDFVHQKRFGPEVKWLDNSRLLIRYEGGAVMCKATAGTIQIICDNTASSR